MPGAQTPVWFPEDVHDFLWSYCKEKHCNLSEAIAVMIRDRMGNPPKNQTSSNPPDNSNNGSTQPERKYSEADAGADKKNYDYSKQNPTTPESSAPPSEEAVPLFAKSKLRYGRKLGA